MSSSRPRSFFLTGCASGIGRHLAEVLLAAGHEVFATDIDDAALRTHADTRAWPLARAHPRRLDVTDPAAWAVVFAEATRVMGKVDVLINVAGYLLPGHVADVDADVVHRHLDVNTKGTAALGELVTNILFTHGPYHSSLGDRQWEYATHVPNLPMALYAAVPPGDHAAHDAATAERALMGLLPPQRQALGQLELVKLLTGHPRDPFGHYGTDDPLLIGPDQVRDVVTGFQERLVAIEGQIRRRNADREFPYHGMLPSRSANSASV